MQLNQLQPKTKLTQERRIGRGGKHGKTGGRGHKGQKSRAGHHIRPAERDMLKKIPKLRGYGVNRSRTINPERLRPKVVNLDTLESLFNTGDQINPQLLLSKGLVTRYNGRVPQVKVLGKGMLSKKLTITGCAVSHTARAQIEKAGGEIL